jgi:hypothetical protein
MRASTHINVENAFAGFVRTIEGEVVEDIVGPSPDFKNADYIFRSLGVIAELKRLADDKAEDKNLQAKIQAKFDTWMLDGTIGPAWGQISIKSGALPQHCRSELMSLYKPSIRRRIAKANLQIKQTKERFGMEGAKGLLILVNDGNYALEANALLYVVNQILGKNFNSINSIVYCTVNMLATTPLTAKPALIWIHAIRNEILEPVDTEFVTKLFRGWKRYVQELIAEDIEEVLMPSNLDVNNIRYVKKLRP